MSLQRSTRVVSCAVLAAAVSAMWESRALALTGHFDLLQDGNYTSTIYAGPIGNEGVGAWTTSGHLLTRGNNYINEFDPVASGTHQGTSVHNVLATHFVPGLQPGAGITNATDGYLYVMATTGIQRVDPNNWAAPAVNMPNSLPTGGYSINGLPNGKIVYSDSGGNSNVYTYDPVTQINTLIYTAGFLVDDIETGPGGQIALAGQSNSSITILTSGGSVINSFTTARYPDGLAFGDGPFGNSVYANNNDGSITRYDLGAGYTGTPTAVDIMTTQTGHHGYGDLATVGPDCAFYIGTFSNPNFTAHGNDPTIGTNWDNGTSNAENSVVRIGSQDLHGGVPGCYFYSFVETLAPEPSSVGLLMAGIAVAARRRGRRA